MFLVRKLRPLTITAIPIIQAGARQTLSHKQPLSVAVPFEPSGCESLEGWWLASPNGEPVTSSLKATSHWADGSVKWAVLRTVVSPEVQGSGDWQLLSPSVPKPISSLNAIPSVTVSQSTDAITIQDGELSYRFHVESSVVFPDIVSAGRKIWNGCNFQLVSNDSEQKALEFSKTSINVTSHDDVSALITVLGHIQTADAKRIDVSLHFEILSGDWLKLRVQIHNPHRARHSEYLWDLGDEGSINISELSLRYEKLSADAVSYRAEEKLDWISVLNDECNLFQASSGGANWNSVNHVDADGQLQSTSKGYQIQTANTNTVKGDRATPVVWVETEQRTHWGFTLSKFWQNFPKSLSFSDTELCIGLFPIEHGSTYELQGGERKTHEIVFSFSEQKDSLDWVDRPDVFTVPTASAMNSQALRYAENEGGDAYNALISESLSPSNGFLAKREVIDEYGWRNFGDIFADHETLYHESDDLFISHYNNQYDPIYGFARQFLLTGDDRWYELMDDLAKHVLDIDIYRTDEDRVEYNHGLFWHTDHYKKASTCSHRSYSRDHYIDWHGDKGGGPGGEHCYTSGLVLYYQMTGNADARNAVLNLTNWVRFYYEGNGGVLDTLKNLATGERRKFLSLIKGQKVLRYDYRLDRGTGNYIRALLDSFEITRDKQYLAQVESIMVSTFSDVDDFSARDLDDPEYTWFYCIFLQEIILYLDIKRELNELDDAFIYARNALLHYVRWMVENETPYLSQPERLLFPNDTWITQDIRKANVLYAAYRYALDDRESILSKARYFRDYVIKGLSQSDTLHFSRMQIIMLQNHGPSGLMDIEVGPYPELSTLSDKELPSKACFYTLTGLIGSTSRKLFTAIRKFSLTREIQWVKVRL